MAAGHLAGRRPARDRDRRGGGEPRPAAAELARPRGGATGAELKKRTLTNLYNARPTWLAHAHAWLDRAVWAAYGWDESDPATVDEDTILARLLALNLEQSGTETTY